MTRKFSDEDHPLGWFRQQKFAYFVKRKAGMDVTDDYLKKAAGPYNPQAGYRAESIAIRKNYVIKKSDTALGVGKHITEAEKYFPDHLQPALDWVADNLRYKNDLELEVLATVDYSMIEIEKTGKEINLDAVKTYIASDNEWEKKLYKENFTDNKIQQAIDDIGQLLY